MAKRILMKPELSIILSLVLVWSPLASAGAAAPQRAKPQDSADAAGKSAASKSDGKVPHYRYEAKGRRDPFRSLDVANIAQATSAPIVRPRGLRGQLVSEMNVVGLVEAKGKLMAIATGYEAKTFFLKEGDELYDGKVLEIRKDSVVFSQILTDSFGKKIPQRVIKKLHPTRGEGNNAK